METMFTNWAGHNTSGFFLEQNHINDDVHSNKISKQFHEPNCMKKRERSLVLLCAPTTYSDDIQKHFDYVAESLQGMIHHKFQWQ